MDKVEQFFSNLFFLIIDSSEMESLYNLGRNLIQGLYLQKKTFAKAGKSEDCSCWQDLEINSVI